jgi:hypothetical protein
MDRHTESSLFDLFGRKGEHREYFNHYLGHYFSHRGSRRDLGISPEPSEEVLDAFEDIDQSVVTFPYILGHLAVLNMTRSGAELRRYSRIEGSRYLRKQLWQVENPGE